MPATASRKLGRTSPVTGEEYSERATFLRMFGQAALHQLDVDEFNASFRDSQ